MAAELAGLGVALPHAGAHPAGLVVAVVLAVAAALTSCLLALQAVVGVDPLLVVGVMFWSSSKAGPSLAVALSTDTSMRRSPSSTLTSSQGMRVLY
jgi:hypothetical protein